MNRLKAMLRGATALAIFGFAGYASAQSLADSTLALLPAPAAQGGCGTATGVSTKAAQISANGSVTIGVADTVPDCIVRWTNGASEVIDASSLMRSAGAYFIIGSMNGDGSVFTARAEDVAMPFDAFRTRVWTQATNFVALPDIRAGEVAVEARGISTDGTYIAINSNVLGASLGQPGLFERSFGSKAYRWSTAGGYESLGSLGRTDASEITIAQGISGDGRMIVGGSFIDTPFSTADRSAAFVWREGVGMEKLPDLSAGPRGNTITSRTTATGISRDGSTIIGLSSGDDGFVQAVHWRNGVVTGMGFVPGYTPSDVFLSSTNVPQPYAASDNGAVIVGNLFTDTFDSRAWRWTAASGMQDLTTVANNAGLNLDGYTVAFATSISDDGQKIAGTSFNATLNQSAAFSLQLAQVTQSRLIVTIRLPGVTQTAIVNQTFSTQVDALLNGTNVFTRTVSDPITGALGVTALADARAALQVGSGLRRVVIGAPVLISNTTSVLSTTNAVVDVASGTSTSTATVNTFGPATVATGDLGTCATAAANNTNPTGCSLPGTPVSVDAGILNSNVFTNTLNAVTPTTTPTVNQLVSAKWQVAATAGNQFGTVHALSGVAAFDRGDRLIGQLLGLGGGQAGSATRVARAAMPVSNGNSLGGGESGLTMFGGYFGNWSHIDADASVPVARVKGSTNGFVLGLEKALGQSARAGVAVDHGTSDYTVRDATYPETLKFKHTQVALFGGWQGGGFSLNGAAAYGFGTARTSLTTPITPATASRDVKSWSLGAQGGYTVPLGKSASVELVGGVRHVTAKLEAFTEVGGPSPLQGRDQTVSRTRVYGGIEAQAGVQLGSVTLTPRLHARYAHDSGDASGTADLVFASAPNGPVMTAVGPGVGRAVAELGGSIDVQVSGNVHVWAGYDGTFRKGAQGHAAKAGLTVAF